jgi:hypothetical protein
MPRSKSSAPRKDPAGGLTAAGREYFRRKEGAHLREGNTIAGALQGSEGAQMS